MTNDPSMYVHGTYGMSRVMIREVEIFCREYNCKIIQYYSRYMSYRTVAGKVVVGNTNGVPEVSHVVSNVAETDVVSKERFSRSSTVSFALDSSIGGVSTVHNHRSSMVQFPVESCTLG